MVVHFLRLVLSDEHFLLTLSTSTLRASLAETPGINPCLFFKDLLVAAGDAGGVGVGSGDSNMLKVDSGEGLVSLTARVEESLVVNSVWCQWNDLHFLFV